MAAKRLSQPVRHRNVANAIALGGRDVPLPLLTLDPQLPVVDVRISPSQRSHLAGTKAGVAAE
jgi:hypothetical protein